MDGIVILFIVVALVVIVGTMIVASITARKRREAMAAFALKLGLRYSADDHLGIATRFSFLNRLAQGSNRYAYNVLSGNYQQHEVLAFDYHYETHSTNSKGHRQTHHHYFSFCICILPMDCVELTIVEEGFMSKIAQALGYDDIDFESAEFSRKFVVRSKDKQFAYHVCNAQMIAYLLGNTDLIIELEGTALSLGFNSCLDVNTLEYNLGRLLKIRSLLPNYLFTKS